MKQSPYQLFMGVVLLCTVTFLSWQAGSLAAAGVQFIHAENGSGEKKKYIVCVDPGHGGTDPGKVGINGQLEKDINLAIAKKLKTFVFLQEYCDKNPPSSDYEDKQNRLHR